ncbi:GGDEF domain-containing protein [Treponema brennaborense]|uniref:GGDEF domain containing protein n=1 Tax=Treponema brennaborense (strain DSM 12168 / CIP 105900 / DD5/3) TaxID=906968 RepID=F4LP85_TREBD|nr:GGDEF domain-containing protein [Treponema brennaborense]AEE16947.1 GGDEF domain containing protein [Treponema brennaborense DSM 12168]
MERKGITIFSICIALAFAAALVFFGTAIYSEYRKNVTGIQAAAADFIQNAAAVSEYYAPESTDFAALLRNKIDSEPHVAAVTVTRNNKTVFAYPLSSSLITTGSDGSPQMAASSALVRLTSRVAGLGSGENAVITTAAYVIQPASIYAYARISFLLILAGTLCAAILLLYVYLTDRQNDEPEEVPYTAVPEFGTKSVLRYDSAIPPLYEDAAVPEYPNEVRLPEAETEPNEVRLPNAESEPDEVQLPNAESEPNVGNAAGAPLPVSGAIDPTGLFSPVTGFGWESYLEERLDSELIRSASSEEDLTLMIFRFPGLDRASPLARNICAALLDFFKFRDLVFEYGEDGYSGILHDTDLETAIELAEELHAKLNLLLEEAGFTAKMGIGISTRSFRLIPGKRLFTEAEQALVHALEDLETSIVAFRVDPDKYRQYISESAQHTAKNP